MQNKLDMYEAVKSYKAGEGVEVWSNVYNDWTDVVGVTGFFVASLYRIKSKKKTLWIAGWPNKTVTALYSVSNPWPTTGPLRSDWIEHLTQHWVE